jgi:hypothetical protein
MPDGARTTPGSTGVTTIPDPHQFTAQSSEVGTYDCAGVEQ